MDRNIVEALYKRGLITTVNCDLSKYNSIEEFITKNISYVGAMPIINDIMKKYANNTPADDNDTITIIDKPEVLDTFVETVEETPVETVEETPVETVEETPVETVEETPVETVEETPVETVEETPVETVEETPKKKKSTKKTE